MLQQLAPDQLPRPVGSDDHRVLDVRHALSRKDSRDHARRRAVLDRDALLVERFDQRLDFDGILVSVGHIRSV